MVYHDNGVVICGPPEGATHPVLVELALDGHEVGLGVIAVLHLLHAAGRGRLHAQASEAIPQAPERQAAGLVALQLQQRPGRVPGYGQYQNHQRQWY